MGLFDRLSKKSETAQTQGAVSKLLPQIAAQSPIISRLREAREKLDKKDLEAAIIIYEEVLHTSGDRADVLVTISADLGSTGYVEKIIELVAPRYDANRHGPATGINVLQAYLAVRNAEAAQHILDLLFSLNRPDIEERLHGFSNAITEIMLSGESNFLPPSSNETDLVPLKISIVTISKPIWFYGLESIETKVLPAKTPQNRRIAFTQLALPGAYFDVMQEMKRTEDELCKLTKVIPLWLSEGFSGCINYASITAVAFMEYPDATRCPMIFDTDWSTEQLRQLNETNSDHIDYAVTGTLKQRGEDYELNIKVWEIKKYRERKQFVARWNPASADVELERLRQTLCAYMECSPVGLTLTATTKISSWLDSLGASLNLFLAEKKLLPLELLPSLERLGKDVALLTQESEAASLAWITFEKRCKQLSVTVPNLNIKLLDTELIKEAKQC